LFREAEYRFPRATFNEFCEKIVIKQRFDKEARKKKTQTLEEKRQEGNHEHQENTDNATLDPGEDGVEVVASRLATNELSRRRVLADRKIRVQSSNEDH